jgi:hypothetical protein
MKKRLYKTGSTWALWRWTEVDSEYIRRLHVVKTPWFAICLHWILKPDPEPYLHDHPVSFLSLILRGGYTERQGGYWRTERLATHRWYNWIDASDGVTHTITDVKPKTLTLCLMGPKTRDWGFHTEVGWVYWRDYYRVQRAKK